MAKIITRQAVYEYTRSVRFTNKALLGKELMKHYPAAQIAGISGRMLHSPLDFYERNDPKAGRKSMAIEELAARAPNADRFERIAGVKLEVGKNAGYDAKSRTLILDKEGLMAAAIIGNYFPRQLNDSKDVVNAIFEGKEIPKAEPADVACALFFVHVCMRGIDGQSDDVRLKAEFAIKAAGENSMEYVQELRNELLRIHGNFAKVLNNGSAASLV